MTEQNSKQNHPEAELLVAFAEHSLTPHERESVLMHLADCAECREILFVAQYGLPEEQSAAVVAPASAARANWFAWRPITVAACLLLTVGVLTEQIYQRTHSTNQTMAKNTPAPLPPSAAGNLVKNTSVSPANVPPAHAPAPMSAASPNAIAASAAGARCGNAFSAGSHPSHTEQHTRHIHQGSISLASCPCEDGSLFCASICRSFS
jgi:hypothetical protein